MDQAKVWQSRHGGTPVSQLASAVTAAMQLEERITRMPLWLGHARALAAAIRTVPGFCRFELSVAEPALRVTHEEAAAAFASLLQ